MASIADLLTDSFGRIREHVHGAVADLDIEQLSARLDSDANSIAWLIWHLTRVQDDHVADVAAMAQVWHEDGWCDRFALPFDRNAIGYGHSTDEVAAVRIGSDLLLDYHDAVHAQTVSYVRGLADADLDEIVDASWDPPVTLGVRLVCVISDDLQHVGQAAFVRGVLLRRQ
jgi:uncharacterized damage-inducible protein DinB